MNNNKHNPGLFYQMEPYSVGLLICGVTVALYQMSGTPFVLNVIIFCLVLLLSLCTMCISGYRLPSDVLFYWIYPKSMCQDKEGENAPTAYHDDEITKKLRQLTGHIVRDFILSWYNALTDDVTFVQEAFELFEHLLTDARARVTQTEKERLLSNVLSEFLKHIETYKNAVKQVDAKGIGSGKDEDKRRDQLIAIAYCSDNPHPALASLPDSDMEYLRGVVALLLKGLLPEDYKLNETSLYLVRELIAQNVLNSVVNLMSDPLWIYNTLVEILDEREVSATDTTDSMEVEGGEILHAMGVSSPAMETTQNEDSGVIAEDIESGETVNRDEECVASPEDRISLSHSSSVTSRQSVDSQDFSEMTSANSGDIPLPLMSSEMHFAPDCNRVVLDAATVGRHLLSTVVERATQERLFHLIRITEYTIMKENFDPSKKYALYKITFKTKESVPIQSSTPVDIPTEENASSSHGNPESMEAQEKIITKRHQVQRRFREFLVLQERLSQNMVAKNLVGDIKGPSRMFPVPFGNMDKDYIEQRRKFLQAYLRHICAIPFISNTKEVKEFLAHEMDPRIAYVKKPEPMPRLDKLFKSAIQDLLGSTTMKFSSLVSNKEADQAFQTEQHSALKPTHFLTNSLPPDEVSNIGAVTKLKNKVFGFSKHAFEKTSTVKANRQFGSFEGHGSSSSKWTDDVGVITTDSTQNHITRLEAKGLGDGCDAIDMTTTRDIETKVLPANLILKLVLKVWDLPPGKHGLTAIVLTNYIQAYLSEKVCELTTKQSWTKYLGLLHDALWPGGQWESSGSIRPTWVTVSDEVKSKAVTRAEICLKKALPDALVYLMSEEDYNSGIKLITESLQNSNINRQLIYRLFDLVIFEVFPDLDQVSHYTRVSLTTPTPASSPL